MIVHNRKRIHVDIIHLKEEKDVFELVIKYKFE